MEPGTRKLLVYGGGALALGIAYAIGLAQGRRRSPCAMYNALGPAGPAVVSGPPAVAVTPTPGAMAITVPTGNGVTVLPPAGGSIESIIDAQGGALTTLFYVDASTAVTIDWKDAAGAVQTTVLTITVSDLVKTSMTASNVSLSLVAGAMTASVPHGATLSVFPPDANSKLLSFSTVTGSVSPASSSNGPQVFTINGSGAINVSWENAAGAGVSTTINVTAT